MRSVLVDLMQPEIVRPRDVEAAIRQPLPHLSLPLTKNVKMTVDLSSTKFVVCYNQKV